MAAAHFHTDHWFTPSTQTRSCWTSRFFCWSDDVANQHARTPTKRRAPRFGKRHGARTTQRTGPSILHEMTPRLVRSTERPSSQVPDATLPMEERESKKAYVQAPYGTDKPVMTGLLEIDPAADPWLDRSCAVSVTWLESTRYVTEMDRGWTTEVQTWSRSGPKRYHVGPLLIHCWRGPATAGRRTRWTKVDHSKCAVTQGHRNSGSTDITKGKTPK